MNEQTERIALMFGHLALENLCRTQRCKAPQKTSHAPQRRSTRSLTITFLTWMAFAQGGWGISAGKQPTFHALDSGFHGSPTTNGLELQSTWL